MGPVWEKLPRPECLNRSVGDTFAKITYVAVIDRECLIRPFIFLLHFISIFRSPREVSVKPTFFDWRRREVEEHRVTQTSGADCICALGCPAVCRGPLVRRV